MPDSDRYPKRSASGKRPRILVVDDEPANLQVLRQILRDHYHLFFATNGERALAAAAKYLPDLILLDIMMPDVSGYEVCRQIKANPSTEKIPVIFVTSMSDEEDEVQGFSAGGVDYIQKPISAPILLHRVRTHLSLVRAQELEDSYKQAIFMLGEVGHYNDADTGAHTWRMAAYARALAAAAGWPDHMAERIELAASMHDTGKVGTPGGILRAPRKLTGEEREIMKQHSEIGFHILSKSDSPIFKMAAEIAHRHHEKWDGSGYPGGLAGTAIPESARIVALADVFDALASRRPYKEPWSVENCLAEIHRQAGSHFDPRLVALFDDILPEILLIKEEWDRKARTGNAPAERYPDAWPTVLAVAASPT
jgi:putative two-component system response regulator